MAKLSQEKIELIVRRYAIVKTYSGVAKELGCSPATVKKYVTLNAAARPKVPKTPFTGKILDAITIIVPPYAERGDWLVLSEAEKQELKLLQLEV